MSAHLTHSLTLLGCIAAAGLAIFAADFSSGDQAANDETVYELRTYTTHPGRLAALHDRFANHTLKLFEKHGMTNVMYWTPTDEKLKANTLIYYLKHKSMAAAKASWAGFRADPEWIKVRTESEKDNPIVLKVESVFMKTTAFSPKK